MTAVAMSTPTLTAASSARGALWWARIVCLSAVVPYVTGIARTEQIAVFALFAVVWSPTT